MRSLLVLCLLVASTYAFHLGKPIIDPNQNWRVVGGSNAAVGEYPHQISLRYTNFHICGGSIVDEEWVITAAHCIHGESASTFTVVAGTNKLNLGGDSYQVLEMHYHENFTMTTVQNDVAILKVSKIKFNEKVNKISVGKDNIPGEEPVILTGWGSTRFEGMLANDLQQLNLKTTSVKQCQEAHLNNNSPYQVEASQICTLTKTGEGACHGDSGGPLITDVNGNRELVGIVSWGQPCAMGIPDVFARVSSYFDWFNHKCNNCIL